MLPASHHGPVFARRFRLGLAPGLQASYTIQALEQAIIQSGGGNLCGTIHHSDRGSQYACDAYINVLTESYKPTDNAVAERMNGILKCE